jgi:hypothetical protein
MSEHIDETGQPCTRHATLAPTRLFELATLGSRMPAFHHDAASKLQSLMMALDEMSELASESEPDMRTAIDTAHAALRDLNQILSTNRALAKAWQKSRIGLAELVQRASESVGVRVRGDVQAQDIRVAVPAVRHAMSLVLDLVAGPSHLGRVVDVTCTFDGDRYEMTVAGPPEAATKLPPNAAESLAIVKFVIDREDGELRCTPTGFVVRMPAAPPPSGPVAAP